MASWPGAEKDGEEAMNRERFEELARLKGMDVTRANRRITFVNLEVI